MLYSSRAPPLAMRRGSMLLSGELLPGLTQTLTWLALPPVQVTFSVVEVTVATVGLDGGAPKSSTGDAVVDNRQVCACARVAGQHSSRVSASSSRTERWIMASPPRHGSAAGRCA